MKDTTPFLHPEHCDTNAVGIISALQKQGFTAYLVGGCVRDLLLGIEPKDFDIATNARPQQIKRCIKNAYIIGRRFRLVVVRHENYQFEVSTFRRTLPTHEQTDYKGMVLDNAFGKPEQDAKRRDFTINGLFYDPVEHKVIDYVGGEKDLQRGLVRTIGPAEDRVVEDPVRILRAIRLAHKIGFAIDTSLKQAIQKHAATLGPGFLPRTREEVLKFLRLQEPRLAFLRSFDLGVLPYLSQALHKLFLNTEQRQQFLHDLDALSHQDLQSTEELLGVLVLAYLKNTTQLSQDQSTPQASHLNQAPQSDQASQFDQAPRSAKKTRSRKTKKSKKPPKPPYYLPKSMKEPSNEVNNNPDYKNIKQKLKHLACVNFMKHELGMSNVEQRVVWKYFQLYPKLVATTTPLTKAAAAKPSEATAQLMPDKAAPTDWLRSEAFLFSLKMSSIELHLGSEQQAYWYQQWRQYAEQVKAMPKP